MNAKPQTASKAASKKAASKKATSKKTASAKDVAAAHLAEDASASGKKAASKTPAGVLSTKRYYEIDPSMVTVVEGWNARMDFGDIEDLANQIEAAGGIIEPIRVNRNKEGGFDIVAGERRFRALQILKERGKKFPLPAIIADRSSSVVDKLVQMYQENGGKPFLPLEEAAFFLRLRKDHGMTLEQITKATGRSDVFVMDRLKLMEAAPEVQEMIKAGQLPVTVANDIIRESESTAEQVAMAQAATTPEGRQAVNETVQTRRQTRRQERAARTGKPAVETLVSKADLLAALKSQEQIVAEALEAVDMTAEEVTAETRDDGFNRTVYEMGILAGMKKAFRE